MKFDTPATTNPIDQLKVVGQPVDRIDGPLKTTGAAPYAYDRHDVVANQAYGYIVASAIPKGRIVAMDLAAAKAASGVIAIVTAQNAGKLTKGNWNTALLLGGPQIQHYHQAIGVVVAETFEQARAAANLVRVEYSRVQGAYDLASLKDSAPVAAALSGGNKAESAVGDFGGAFAAAPVQRQVRDGRWLVGMGVASALRDNLLTKSAARVHLDRRGVLTVETDMTDIGTGSYTVIAQTAAETMGVPIDKVVVRLGDSSFPVSCGSGGQWGGNNSTAGVYAACMKLRGLVAEKANLKEPDIVFANGQVRSGPSIMSLADLAGDRGLVAEDFIEYGDLDKRFQQSTFGAHFVEVGVDAYTGETRVRRMLAVCACGRILNPKTARSQVIGAMVMGAGAALMEELVVDKRRGYFVNHDLASYEVPVHADIPHQEVIFLDETDPVSSPMKAKGVAELGICGVAAAVANAVYNATGVRVRDYPITLDKLLDRLPAVT
jgi:CO/xanthine dehydrogenase Mo-binding subunit